MLLLYYSFTVKMNTYIIAVHNLYLITYRIIIQMYIIWCAAFIKMHMIVH